MRSDRRFAFASAAAFLMLVAAMSASGCGGATIESVCGKCPSDTASCTTELTQTQTLAHEAGCDTKFQAVLDCADSKGTCDTNGSLSASDACAADVIALSTCTGSAMPG